MGVVSGENGLQARLLGGQLVEVGIRLAIGGVDPVQIGLGTEHIADAFLDRLAHGMFGLEPGLLFEITDLDAGLRPGLTLKIGIDTGHDPQHGGLACTVQSEQADLGAGKETERDVLDDLLLRRNGLADAVHRVDVLHGGFDSIWRRGKPIIIAWQA